MVTGTLKSWGGKALLGAIVLTIGNGAYWQWQSSRLAAKQHHLRVLEERSVVYQRLAEEFDKYKAFGACQAENKQEAQHLTTNISLLNDRFKALEAEAAHLEARAPRDIEPDFMPKPCPATGPSGVGGPVLR